MAGCGEGGSPTGEEGGESTKSAARRGAAAAWSALPAEVAEVVLSRLPACEVGRLRSAVCRSWRSAMSSPHFLRAHALLHPRRSSRLLLYTHDVAISSSLIASSAPISPWEQHAVPASYVRDWTGAHSGLLLCIRSHLLSHGYHVGNPLSGLWTRLPDPPDRPASVAKLWCMLADPNSPDLFRVLLLHKGTPAALQIYCSTSRQWAASPVPGTVDAVFASSAACVGQLVYCVQARGIVAYDERARTWERVERGELPADVAYQFPIGSSTVVEEHSRDDCWVIDGPPKVVQGPAGRVLMVGLSCYSSAAAVWELDRQRGWAQVARAPGHMWRELQEDAKESRSACGGGVLPIRFAGQGEAVVVMAGGSARAIAYNLIDARWAWLHLPPTANCDLSLCFELLSDDLSVPII